MPQTTDHIITTLKNEEDFLKRRYFIDHVVLYGSYAKSQQSTESDIDLLYTTMPGAGMTLARLKSVENYLSGLLSIKKIELVHSASLNPVVKENIEDHAIPIF
jgi:predicted nucleotidyltransferase